MAKAGSKRIRLGPGAPVKIIGGNHAGVTGALVREVVKQVGLGHKVFWRMTTPAGETLDVLPCDLKIIQMTRSKK